MCSLTFYIVPFLFVLVSFVLVFELLSFVVQSLNLKLFCFCKSFWFHKLGVPIACLTTKTKAFISWDFTKMYGLFYVFPIFF